MAKAKQKMPAKRNRTAKKPAPSLKAAERKLLDAAEHNRMWAKIRKYEDTYKACAARVFYEAGIGPDQKCAAIGMVEQLVLNGTFYGKPRRERRIDNLDYGNPAYPRDSTRIISEYNAVSAFNKLPGNPVANLVVLEMARCLVLTDSFIGWDAKSSPLHKKLAQLEPMPIPQQAA